MGRRKSKTIKVRGLRARRGHWHYRFRIRGEEYTGNTELPATSQHVNDASAVREKERQRILRGDLPTPEICPFNRAAAKFLEHNKGEHRAKPKTAERNATSFVSLCDFFYKDPVQNIRPVHIDDFKAWRRGEQIAEVTIRHDLHALSKFFQYAIRQGWATTNPVREVQMPSDEDAQREYILTPDEEALYFAKALELGFYDLHDVGRLMIQQGNRPEELFGLAQDAVDLERRYMNVKHGKSKAARRQLRLMPESVDILRRRLARPGVWVFPSPVKPGHHIAKLNNPHHKVCEAIEIDFVPYDLRHTFATRMYKNGCDIATLAKILGHGNLRSVMRYVHLGQEASDDAMERYGRKSGPAVRVRSTFAVNQGTKQARQGQKEQFLKGKEYD